MANAKMLQAQVVLENVNQGQVDQLIFEALGALFDASISVKVYRRCSERTYVDQDMKVIDSEITIFPNFNEAGNYLIARVAAREDLRLYDQIEVGGYRFEVNHIGGPIHMGPFELKDIAAKRI